MKHLLIGVLSSAAALAFVCATPALANGGGDANAEADQAQFHVSEPNQTPDWAPGQVAVGEVYRGVPGEDAFYGPNGVRALGIVSAPTRSCPRILDTTNGRETIVCGM